MMEILNLTKSESVFYFAVCKNAIIDERRTGYKDRHYHQMSFEEFQELLVRVAKSRFESVPFRNTSCVSMVYKTQCLIEEILDKF